MDTASVRALLRTAANPTLDPQVDSAKVVRDSRPLGRLSRLSIEAELRRALHPSPVQPSMSNGNATAATPAVTQPSAWECFRADRARYPANAWFAERSLWAIAVYRFGQSVMSLPAPRRALLRPVYRAMLLIVQILTNIEIGTRAEIGPGLRIHHVGPIVIGDVTIGRECTLRVGNVLGNRSSDEWPSIGDRVELGAGAQILGGITVGDDVKIGAMSLVIHDVPPNTVVVGVPARPVSEHVDAI